MKCVLKLIRFNPCKAKDTEQMITLSQLCPNKAELRYESLFRVIFGIISITYRCSNLSRITKHFLDIFSRSGMIKNGDWLSHYDSLLSCAPSAPHDCEHGLQSPHSPIAHTGGQRGSRPEDDKHQVNVPRDSRNHTWSCVTPFCAVSNLYSSEL